MCDFPAEKTIITLKTTFFCTFFRRWLQFTSIFKTCSTWPAVMSTHIYIRLLLSPVSQATILASFTKVEVPRCHHHLGYIALEIKLHIFHDASALANGVAAYLKLTFKGENPYCS